MTLTKICEDKESYVMNLSESEENLIEWGIAEIISKYEKCGIKLTSFDTDGLYWELCGLLHRDGEVSVTNYINNYKINMTKKVIGYGGVEKC